jgi:hypothetical protein
VGECSGCTLKNAVRLQWSDAYYRLKQAVESSKSRRTEAEAILQGGISLPTNTTRQP